MRVLIVDDSEEMREIVNLILTSNYNVEVVEANGYDSAIQILQKNFDFDCVISDYNMPPGLSGGKLFQSIESMGIPFVLCSSDRPEEHEEFKEANLAGHVVKPDIQEPLIRILDGIMLLKNLEISRPSGYSPIRISTLLRLGQMPCDMYVKLGLTKFIKVFKKDSFFSEKEFERYKRKQADCLYVASSNVEGILASLVKSYLSMLDFDHASNISDHILTVMDSISDITLRDELAALNHMVKKLEQQDSTYGDFLKLSEKTHTTIQKSIAKLGLTTEVQELIKSSVKLSMETIKKLPALEELVTKLNVNPENYISTHSILLGHIAGSIAIRLNWSSPLTLYKLSLAAFLHDITIENPEHAKAKFRKDLHPLRSQLSDSVYLELARHPEDCAKLVREMRQIPPDVDRIVLEHHEWPEGQGFPNSKSVLELSPLSCIFIFAHVLVDDILETYQKSLGFDALYRQQAPHFGRGLFKKIFTVMAGYSPVIGKVKLYD